MKKMLLGLCFVLLGCIYTITANATSSTDKSLDIAKRYEGNFYNHCLFGNWYVFSDKGVSLGDPIDMNIPSNSIKYYINEDEGYIIQYYESLDNIVYGVWHNGTLIELSSSRY